MKVRRKMLAATTFLCALVASLAFAAGPAAAEAPGPAPIRDLDEAGMSFPAITSPEAPEEYPFRVDVGEEQYLRQVSPTEVDAFYSGHQRAFEIDAEDAHDAVGAAVPTTLELTEPDVVTLTVHYREGNPAAGDAPFAYPVSEGKGWEGGFTTVIVEMPNPQAPTSGAPSSPTPAPNEAPPVPDCKVPPLRGLSLHAAKAHLRRSHCRVGAVYLGTDASVAKGKVVRQFHPAGTELAAGSPVSIKVGRRGA